VTDVIEPPVADHRGEADPRAEADSPADAVPALTRVEAMALIERCETAARNGEPLTRPDALDVLRISDADTVAAVSAAGRIRRAHYGNTVKMNFLVNLKSGLCPEDCSYCSQRRGSEAGIMTYRTVGADVVADAAERAVAAGAARVCLVASGRGPTEGEIEQVADAVMAVRDAHPGLEVCACLGLLAEGQAERLADAGVDAYNHNLNTSEAHYGDICATHGFDDRVNTVESAKHAGLSPCSGALFGMGETDDDIVDVGFALRALEVDSVPINFLIPIDGTPLAGRWELTPQRCLRILALYRFLFPTTEIRIAGGREVHLRSVQGLALEAANSIFVGDYLTTEGQAANADLQLLDDWGFVPLDLPDDLRPESERPSRSTATGEDAGRELVRIRRRGVGSELPPNA
jgi:biotin synthase